jgi:COP9 signalosome complex subunit 3
MYFLFLTFILLMFQMNREEFFEIAIGAPAQVPSAVQWDALKKLVLVQCIARGKTLPTPKYMHPSLARMLKSSPYGAFSKAYPRSTAQLAELVEKEKEALMADKNLGLIQQALDRAARWNLKRLTDTYLTLGLAEIGKEVGIQSQDTVRELVVSMVRGLDKLYATYAACMLICCYPHLPSD